MQRLIFSTNNMIGSVLIRFGTWSRFSHVDLIMPDGQTVVGSTALAGGVHEYPLKDRIAESRSWAIYECDADGDLVAKFARSQIGKAYDWLGCIGIAFHRDWQGGDKWFCSELSEWCLAQAKFPLVNPDLRLNRVTPETQLRSPLLRLVDTNDLAKVATPEIIRSFA